MDANRTGSLKGRKRRSSPLNYNISQSGEVKMVLNNIRDDISKAFVAKRKCLESFMSSSYKTSQQKFEELWKSQQRQRAQMSEDYCTQFNSVFQQWDSDIQQSKEQSKKLMALFQQKQKLFQQMRASQGKRLKTLKYLVDHYINSAKELQDSHEKQNTGAMSELRQEMALLQKQIFMRTQKEELAYVRKALQSMLM